MSICDPITATRAGVGIWKIFYDPKLPTPFCSVKHRAGPVECGRIGVPAFQEVVPEDSGAGDGFNADSKPWEDGSTTG